MSATDAALSFLILILVSFVPALVYLSWVRRTERYQTEAWGPLLRAFFYGALFATFIAALVEAIILGLGDAVSSTYPGPEFIFLNSSSTAGAFFLVLVVAPFVEEALKGSGVVASRRYLRFIADGPVFGAAVGLGFGFFETFLYGLGAWIVGGIAAGIALILLRSVSSVLLHGSSTGMFGYGYARHRFGAPGAGTGTYYLVAVGMHSAFNAIASLPLLLALIGITGIALTLGSGVALLIAVLFAFVAIQHVRDVIQASNYPALRSGPARYAPRPPPGPS